MKNIKGDKISIRLFCAFSTFVWSVLFTLSTFPSTVQAQTCSFSAPTIIAIGQNPKAIITQDFNNDQAPDLAVAIRDAGNANPLAIYMNDGSGVIGPEADSMYANPNYPVGMAAGDFNNDQITDLAVSIDPDSSVAIYLGNGDGTFSAGNRLKVTMNPGDLVAADFDNDSNSDLAIISRNSVLMIYGGDGDGGFTPAASLQHIGSGVDVEAADVNGDNYPDLLLGAGNIRSVQVYLNDGSGNFPSHNNLNTPKPAWFVKVCDFNHDAIPDIISASGSDVVDNVYVFLGQSAGAFTAADTFSLGDYVNHIYPGYYNDDQNMDILISDANGLYVLSGDGDGHITAIDTVDFDSQNYRAGAVSSKDMNNDGTIDVIVAREKEIRIYYNETIASGIAADEFKPDDFNLFQNYPNPFNPTTTIRYQLAAAGHVDLAVFDLLGRRVATLVNERQQAGGRSVSFEAPLLSSGCYFYRLKTETGSLIKTMQIVR